MPARDRIEPPKTEDEAVQVVLDLFREPAVIFRDGVVVALRKNVADIAEMLSEQWREQGPWVLLTLDEAQGCMGAIDAGHIRFPPVVMGDGRHNGYICTSAHDAPLEAIHWGCILETALTNLPGQGVKKPAPEDVRGWLESIYEEQTT